MNSTNQNTEPFDSQKDSASSPDATKAAWFAKNPDQIVCSIDLDGIHKWAVRNDAKQAIRQHHEAIHTAVSHGARCWLSDRKDVSEREVDRLRAEFNSTNIALAKTPHEFIGLGGGEKRTIGMWAKICLFLLIGVSGAVVDGALVFSLVGEAAPEKLTDFAYLAGMMSAAFFSVAALKASTMLSKQDPESINRRFELWARILPWAALPMLAGLAIRYVQLSSDPAALFSEANSTHDYLALVVFFMQLIAGTVVSAGSLLVASRLALLTAPATCRPNPVWDSLNDSFTEIYKKLNEAELQLATEHAQLETLVAHLDEFLGRADAELEAELRRRAKHIADKEEAERLQADLKRLESESLAAELAQVALYKAELEATTKRSVELKLKIEEHTTKSQNRLKQDTEERLIQFRNISDQLSTN